MGCGGHSKLGPDASRGDDDPAINPVFRLDAGGGGSNHNNPAVVVACPDPKKRAGQKYLCSSTTTTTNNNNNNRNNRAKAADPIKVKAVGKAKYDPRVLAKYEVKALIGKGTHGRVVRVEHRITKQPFALKLLDSLEGREAFDAELAVLRRVKHPNVVQLVEVFDGGPSHKSCMVMELATGGDLFDRIVSRGSFTERDATHVLRMVLDGVCYLHALGITHRDLKPDNLLYYHPGQDSKILITDFGLASMRKPSGDMLMHTACGTPEYIAPEIVTRRPYTCAVDMWAIGVIAYVLLSGTFPFDDDNRSRLYKLILRAKYSYAEEHWLDISRAAKEFINQLLVVDPEKRMSAQGALQHPWIVSNASSSLNKNLHRSISQNLFKTSTRNSSRSSSSKHSSRSTHSHRSGRRVSARELQKLNEDVDTIQKDIIMQE